MIKRLKNLARRLLGIASESTPLPSGPDEAAPVLQLPTIAARDVMDGTAPITLLEPEFALGNVTLLELALIDTLIAARKPRKLFEIGTFDGRTSVNMVANAPEDAVLYTLDLPRTGLSQATYTILESETAYVNKEKSGTRFEGTRWQGRITQLYGDSATFDYSTYQGRMDVVFIDGSHHYDYVKNDTAAALKLVADHGLLIWHDYQPFWTGVIAHLEELARSGGIFSGILHVEGTSLAFLEVRR